MGGPARRAQADRAAVQEGDLGLRLSLFITFSAAPTPKQAARGAGQEHLQEPRVGGRLWPPSLTS